MTKLCLEIKDIYKTFNAGTINEKRALNGVNLNLNPGDFVTIIGGNGAGKSTTLNAIAGVWGIDKGNIIIDGTDITKLSEHKRALFLGRVFQDPMTGTAATMSIEENMAIAARRGQKRGLGWKEKGPISIHRLAPFLVTPSPGTLTRNMDRTAPI